MDEKRSRMRRPLAVADLLTASLRGRPAEKRLKEGRIWLLWEEAVGRQIASQAQPVTLRDGILTVAVASAPWMQELNFLKRGIVVKLNALLGEPLVREIFLKAGRIEPPLPPEPEPRPAGRELTTAERELIAAETATVDDPEVRASLARLMARHYAASPPEKRR